MPTNNEFYTGTNVSPFIVKPEILSDGKMYYKIETKEGIESPSFDISIGDAFNAAKDILKISNPIFTSISLSVGFADRLYMSIQESYENPLLKAIFTSNSALDKKTIFSLTNVSSYNNFSIRLDFKENIVFTNSFYEKVT
ncbi:MAG: hypothetical protein COA66_11880 [Arcobacter sp.]|nr:MAG: hypothetical protein COA66_11880 [Arcobacter sp.]